MGREALMAPVDRADSVDTADTASTADATNTADTADTADDGPSFREQVEAFERNLIRGRSVDTLLIGVYPVDARGVYGQPPQKPLSLS